MDSTSDPPMDEGGKRPELMQDGETTDPSLPMDEGGGKRPELMHDGETSDPSPPMDEGGGKRSKLMQDGETSDPSPTMDEGGGNRPELIQDCETSDPSPPMDESGGNRPELMQDGETSDPSPPMDEGGKRPELTQGDETSDPSTPMDEGEKQPELMLGGERPSCFNGPSLHGGDISIVQKPIQEVSAGKMEPEPVYGPVNQDNFSNQSFGDVPPLAPAATIIPLPCPDSLLPGGSFGNTSFTASDSDNLDENEHRYVGLVNQAMTCYLNSLIQTLYMTPEFRNAIYTWKFSGNDEANNIPFQLQKLFLLLQTSDKSSLETKDLTASFGWESSEAYDQHDVQELCRIMFDALERRWRKTENSSIIQKLYQGDVEDYVKCLKCQNERVKKDIFLDMPLAVKQFGAVDSFQSIEEALRAFVKPERLEGSNKYDCERCASKEDAEKGLRITSFPYLLTIQLKRFDFDYQTLHRIKLNDRITFPDFLDVNEFIYKPPPPPEPKLSYAAMAKKPKPAPPKAEEEAELESPPEDPRPSGSGDTGADEKCWLFVDRDAEMVQRLMKRGQYVYELFSIMVHQGSATAGHYFAYIKNLDQNRWFCFNDASVQQAFNADIFRTFGGATGGWSMSNTNAYMLMYRKIDPVVNCPFPRTVSLPEHLVELRERLVEEEAEKARQQQHEQALVKIHYMCNDEKFVGKESGTVLLHKEKTLSEVFETILQNLEQQASAASSDPPIDAFLLTYERARLIYCDCSWEMRDLVDVKENDTRTLEFMVGRGETSFLFRPELYLMVDTKPSQDVAFYTFPANAKQSRTFEVLLVDLGAGQIRLVKRLCIDMEMYVSEVKELLRDTIPQVEASGWTEARIVIDRVFNESYECIWLGDKDLLIMSEVDFVLYGTITMYVDVGPEDLLMLDRASDDNKSKMYELIERKKFSKQITVYLPTAADYELAGVSSAFPLDPYFVSPPMPLPFIGLKPLPPLPPPPPPRPVAAIAPMSHLPPLFNKSTQILPNADGVKVAGADGFFSVLVAASDVAAMPVDPTAEDTNLPSTSAGVMAILTGGLVSGRGISAGVVPDALPSYEAATTAGYMGHTSYDPPPYSDVAAAVAASVAPGCSDNSPDSTHIDEDDDMGRVTDDSMDMSPFPNSPKVSPSPNVSDQSGDEAAMGSENDGRKSPLCLFPFIPQSQHHPYAAAAADDDQQSAATVSSKLARLAATATETETLSSKAGDQRDADKDSASATDTLVGGTESTCDESTTAASTTAVAATTQPLQPQYPVRVVAIEQSAEPPTLTIVVDRRQPLSYLKFWLAQFLRLEPKSFDVLKHYQAADKGFLVSFSNDTDQLKDSFTISLHHITVRLKTTKPDEFSPLIKSAEPDTGSDLHKGRRKERPLRIQMLSVSESDA